MTAKIADDLGRLFEVGFNIGILSYIHKNNLKNRFGNLYAHELENLKFAEIRKTIKRKVVSKLEREIAETWCQFFVQKGFLCGLNFFREYLNSIGCDKQEKFRHLEIIYYQCRFNGDNSIGTHEVNDQKWFKDVLSQFENLEITSQDIDIYKGKGDFLNADSLILLKYRNNYRVLCLDLSVFSIHTDEDMENIDYVEIIRRLLLRDINYIRSKSVFSSLRIDTESLGLDFSPSLKEYFTAFKSKDKESAKLIQAAGYIYSFCQFLEKTPIIPNISKLVCNAVGYSDRSFNTISIQAENLDIFQTCYQIYKLHDNKEEITNARHRVLNQIKRNAASSFDRGKELVNSLLEITPDTINILPRHTEKIPDFYNSVAAVPQELISSLNLTGNPNFREAHSQLIKKYLISENTYIFLTGNPGIGKTTAIVDFLKQYKDDGFLLFYVSPRKQVNLDIIEKFKDKETSELIDDRIFAINSHSNLIQDNHGKFSVAYTSNQYEDDFNLGGVDFLNSENVERKSRRKDRLEHITDDTFQDVGTKTKGVLNSICEGLYNLISCEEYNQIIATASTQSLKKTDYGDTLKHLTKIFRDAYHTGEDKIFPEKMRNISRRIKHLFIMIDEITGDEGGVEFLDGIQKIVSKYQLTSPENGFNTKIIVADASIVDKNVICQHLEDTTPEPNKVYCRKAECNIQPLSVESFKFNNLPAIIINTNTYPAKSLTISYQILIESCKFTDKTKLKNKSDLEKKSQEEIFQDIQNLIQKSDVEQFIVYIQNKPKLAELIDKIQSKLGKDNFIKNIHYLEIHANISEYEKQQIKKYQENVKVVFMTASGSRGLSFPKAKHILVEIPKFEVEKNLMEIIQVIYRGRGNDIIDNQDKYLTFYLAERSIYYQDNQELSQQESILSLLNLLLILKASIMTRIQGYGNIGRKNYLLIPIGGKSVLAAGESFSSQIENLIKQLKKEYNIHKSHTLLKQAYTNLELLMGEGDFLVSKNTEESYLAIRENFNSKFSESSKTFDKLLDFKPLELGYISGGLLIVPSQNIQESYQMRLLDIEKYANAELWNNLKSISRSQIYPESLTYAVKNAIELVERLKNAAPKTQNFIQKSQHIDQYYALPLFAFISGEVMKQYFESNPEEPEDQRFKDILSTYIRSLYPVGNVLPIGHTYKEFPFVVFRSYSLGEIRNKLFTEKYLLNSQELNVLNLILSI
ncbi:helicase [Dolichospermum sp. ST_con]|nr:helicase [Dolichospermum sp. ST_con]MDD1419127.1 helicase [Dolichospermum sp. ST_sed1]MDD1424830.1 helicase [Dolichospermum sp. ST_sed9]MDD1431354.1 helicase [Dolichospermum sp. ST_sed6]MDD1435390.1 helicase [Dolichospermum sp. ST_sed10]MDD1440791.1 helicase [Dolichospermum sp. ST_sed3]MDD1444597.1 helicase [Dolichospermum sp. ST_sed8]MDD1454906.1 helicase [Dolichospermum sp. ST_sed7]MDD1459038.1 helicase [Dolichospermum sp. ST_sed2]MDD1464646.1 helicase [Dolichospermum sp. ST_sed5]MDD